MNESIPKTGATEAEIEQAASMAWDDSGANVPIYTMDPEYRFAKEKRRDARLWASRLIPPGFRVAPPEILDDIETVLQSLSYDTNGMDAEEASYRIRQWLEVPQSLEEGSCPPRT